MKKKLCRWLVYSFLFLLLPWAGAWSLQAKEAPQPQVERIGGADRFVVSLALSKESFQQADTAILVNGLSPADMVLGSMVAQKTQSPLLYLRGKNLDASFSEELARLAVKKVYLIGGPASISPSVEESLAQNYQVQRFGGPNRYEVSLEIAKTFFDASVVRLTDAFDSTDQLLALRYAQSMDHPLIYVDGQGGPKAIREALDREEVATHAPNKLLGRFQSWKHAPFEENRITDLHDKAFSDTGLDHTTSRQALLVNENSFPDLLCALSLVDSENSQFLRTAKDQAIYLVPQEGVSERVESALAKDPIEKITLLGGERTLPWKQVDIQPETLLLSQALAADYAKEPTAVRIGRNRAGELNELLPKEEWEKIFAFPEVRLLLDRTGKIDPKQEGGVRLIWDYQMELPLASGEKLFFGMDFTEGIVQVVNKKPESDFAIFKVLPDDIAALKAYTEALQVQAPGQ